MTPALGIAKAKRSIELRWDPEATLPFPAVPLKALKLMSGTDTSLLDLCNLIRSDTAFSVAVLRVANSPLVSFSKNITSVLQASMVLGFLRLRRVVITVGLKAHFENSFTELIRSCWRHSVACAVIAERSAKWSSLDGDFAYTAGILHDIGRVALATFMTDAYASVIKRGADQPADLLLVENGNCAESTTARRDARCWTRGVSPRPFWRSPLATTSGKRDRRVQLPSFRPAVSCRMPLGSRYSTADRRAAMPIFSPTFPSGRERASPPKPSCSLSRPQTR